MMKKKIKSLCKKKQALLCHFLMKKNKYDIICNIKSTSNKLNGVEPLLPAVFISLSVK